MIEFEQHLNEPLFIGFTAFTLMSCHRLADN